MQMDFWGKEEGDLLDLNEAEEILRQLRKENPVEFERIANLRDGIRAARSSLNKGLFVFCQAGRYQQLFILNEIGAVVTRDMPKVLGVVKCAPDVKAFDLPKGYNEWVMSVQRIFKEEVKHRQAERVYQFNLTHGQLYVIRELRIFFESLSDEEIKANINILEKTFRGALTGAVKRELNQLRRNSVIGEALYKNLIRIYDQHNLKEASTRQSRGLEDEPIPRIVCSEAFV
jgi:hypothetical protein